MNTMNRSVPLPGETTPTGVPGEVGTLDLAYLSLIGGNVIGLQMVSVLDDEGIDTRYVISGILKDGGLRVRHLIAAHPNSAAEAIRLLKKDITDDLDLLGGTRS